MPRTLLTRFWEMGGGGVSVCGCEVVTDGRGVVQSVVTNWRLHQSEPGMLDESEERVKRCPERCD